MGTRILLVDDHMLMRQGLRSLLETSGEFEVVGEAQDGRTAVQLIRELAPQVVVMDLRMPNLNGIDATREALAAQPSVKVIGLSGQADDHIAREMLKAGAAGYVLKEAAFEELMTAIHTVLSDKVYLSPSISGMIVRHYVRGEPTTQDAALPSLSPREREILQLISEGKSTKEVAALLDLSIKTVETHRRNVMEKTQARSIAELTKYAIREGITTLD